MRIIAQMEFIEPEGGDVLFVGIGVTDDNTVGMAFSLERDGDLEVFLHPDQLAKVLAALTEARAAAEARDPAGTLEGS